MDPFEISNTKFFMLFHSFIHDHNIICLSYSRMEFVNIVIQNTFSHV